MRQTIASICVLIGLAGCATPQLPVVKMSSDHRATTSPAGAIRTDGIYVCRGLKAIGSAGGLGFWPFKTPATQLLFVEFLRFDASGNVCSWYVQEPKTDDQARRFFQNGSGGGRSVCPPYEVHGSQVSFVMSALTADFQSRVSTPYVGFIYTDYLSINIDNGEGLPASTRYNYREYDFVPDAETGKATRPAA